MYIMAKKKIMLFTAWAELALFSHRLGYPSVRTVCRGTFGVTSRVKSSISHFKTERGTSLDKELIYLNIKTKKNSIEKMGRGFPSGSMVKNPPTSAGDMDSILDPARSYMPRGD